MTLDDEFDSVQAPPSQAKSAAKPPAARSSMTLFGESIGDSQFATAALIGAGTANSGAPHASLTLFGSQDGGFGGAPTASQRWITVFGYPMGAEDAVRKYFQEFTDVVDVKFTPHNRVHLWCVCFALLVLLMLMGVAACACS